MIKVLAIIGLLYTVIRLFANLFFDADATKAARDNTRRHFSRPHFNMWVDLDGKMHVEGDPDQRDHSQRCRDSLDEWYYIERRLKWNNPIYIALIIIFWSFI